MEEKKLEILERATAVYMKFGIKSVTMDDLSRELAISKKTIYKYFSDKTELVNDIISMKVQMDQAICINNTQQSATAIDDLLSTSELVTENLGNINPIVFLDLQKHFPEAWAIIKNHKWEFVLSSIQENIKRGISEGIYRKDLNPLIIGRQYVVSIDMIMNPEIFLWTEFQFEDLFNEVMRFHLNGMTNEKGRELLKKKL